MRMLKQGTGRTLALLLAGAALASCTAHGQSKKLDPKVYVNYTPYSEAFYENLFSDRVWIFHSPTRRTYRNVPQFMIFRSDGQRLRCTGRWRTRYKLGWIGDKLAKWSIIRRGLGTVVRYDYKQKSTYGYFFYDPETGTTAIDLFRSDVGWTRGATGWVQDTWPRALADACPNLKPPAHFRINEKQTSLKFDELRRQDPDAPIRNFPGSHLTAPGRTGLGASGGRPTTTREEVLTFLRAQEGDVVTSPSGTGYVFSLEGRQSEVWRIADDGGDTKFGTLRDEGDWVFVEVPGQPALKYPVGYPVPVLPTGHRHTAWQLTDELIAKGEPVALPWLGARYADHRFLFHDKTLTVVAPGETYLMGRWRWTKGHLQVWVDGEERHAGSIAWRDLATELGVTPTVWTPGTPDRID